MNRVVTLAERFDQLCDFWLETARQWRKDGKPEETILKASNLASHYAKRAAAERQRNLREYDDLLWQAVANG